jgi:hypothetical protein
MIGPQTAAHEAGRDRPEHREGLLAGDPEALPTRPASSLTTLLRVTRDGNPLRAEGFASPFLGKLGPLHREALAALASAAVAAVPPLSGRTLVVGLTESSLVLAWGVFAHLPGATELWYTTRHPIAGPDARTFLEPHSHGPRHFLALPRGRTFDRIVIVEDELTTGVTIANLILALGDLADRFLVVCLTDNRGGVDKLRLASAFEDRGIRVDFARIEAGARTEDARDSGDGPRERRPPNPYGRGRSVFGGAVRALRQSWRDDRPGTLYVIGECIDVALAFWESLPPGDRPAFRHVTRSPWKVDGRAILSRLELGGGGASARHYLYNGGGPPTDRALIVGDSTTTRVADELGDHLRARGTTPEIIEVPLR